MRRLFARLGQAYENYRSPLWLATQRALRMRHVTVRDHHSGLRFMCLRGADRMLGETFHSRVYDSDFAPVRSGDWVLDVGANHGFSACHFASKGAQVLALEPDPEVFDLLRANVRRNTLERSVRCERLAVARTDGAGELIVSRRLGGGCSTLSKSFAETVALPIQSRIGVRTVSLETLIGTIPADRVRLVKMDCEGSELEALKSLSPFLLDSIDSFAIEYHPEAYPLNELIDLVLSWPAFHVAKVLTRHVANANLLVVHRRAIAEWAALHG